VKETVGFSFKSRLDLWVVNPNGILAPIYLQKNSFLLKSGFSEK
jgi:hypothetical protein